MNFQADVKREQERYSNIASIFYQKTQNQLQVSRLYSSTGFTLTVSSGGSVERTGAGVVAGPAPARSVKVPSPARLCSRAVSQSMTCVAAPGALLTGRRHGVRRCCVFGWWKVGLRLCKGSIFMLCI